MNAKEVYEIREKLNEIVEESGYGIEECLKIMKKNNKASIEMYDDAVESLTVEMDQLIDVYLEDKHAYKDCIDSNVKQMLVMSTEYGNAGWIRKNKYNIKYEWDDSLLSMGSMRTESVKWWMSFFNTLEEEVPEFNVVDAEYEMDRICKRVRGIISDYEDLVDEQYAYAEAVLLCCKIKNSIEDFIDFTRTFNSNVKALHKLLKSY